MNASLVAGGGLHMNASATRMFRRPMIGVVAAPRVGDAVPCVNGTAPRFSVCRKEGQDFANLFTVEKMQPQALFGRSAISVRATVAAPSREAALTTSMIGTRSSDRSI